MRSTGDPELDRQLAQFGENIRQARKQAHFSQIDLSLRAQLDRAAVSFIERAEQLLGCREMQEAVRTVFCGAAISAFRWPFGRVHDLEDKIYH